MASVGRSLIFNAIRAGQQSTSTRVASRRSRSFHQSSKLLKKSPENIGEAFLSKFANGQSFTRKQLIDANQLRLFCLTLDRTQVWANDPVDLTQQEPKEGTPLPAGYHNAYFTPTQLPGALGIDGTDTSYNPEAPFTRRMWAGGSLQWPGSDPSATSQSHLKVGDLATEVTKVLSCEPKTIKKTGEAMLVVGVVKEFYDSRDQLCIVDNRNWVFREALDPTKKATPSPKPAELSAADIEEANKGKLVQHFKRDPADLFRFSALTFNAHRIHYDKPWSVDVEGHRDAVVHGPLNMIALLDLWRDEYGRKIGGSAGGADGVGDVLYPKSLKYRATSPVYVGEGYRILINEGDIGGEDVPVEVVSDDGTTCMKGNVGRW